MLFVQVSTKFCVDRRGIIFRVPECLSLRQNWLPLPPLPQASVSPLDPKGGGNTRLRVRWWGKPIRTTGEKAWHSVYSMVWTILLVQYVGCSRCYHILLCLLCVLFNISTMWKILLSLLVHILQYAYSQQWCSTVWVVIICVAGCKSAVHRSTKKPPHI
jgi:hypothetical protein